MSNIVEHTAGRAEAIGRRGFFGRCAAASVVAGSGVVSQAAAAMVGGHARVGVYKGRYAIDGHRVIDAYMATPRGGMKMDVVVVIPSTGVLDPAAERIAHGHAANGRLAIAPDLAKTYAAAAGGGKAALVAALMADMPRLKRMARGNGTVSFVAA